MSALKTAFDKLALPELGTAIRSLYDASAHREVLDRIDTSLVLIDGLLINTASGEYRQAAESGLKPEPAQLAHAARSLLQGREPPLSILLLLPPADFAATRFNLGITGDKLLRSALKLQAHTLLPAYDDELLLGLQGNSSEGVALWYPEQQANALFAAFQEQDLFLAAVMPRTLALLQTRPDSGDAVLIDEDSRHITLVACNQGAVRALLCVRQVDLQQEAFAAQWQGELGKAGPVTTNAGGQELWRGLRQVVRAQAPYCFFAAGAEKAGRDLIAHRQRRIANIAAGVLVATLFLPFLNNWVQMQLLENRSEALREESTQARQSQAVVFQMEDEWGAVAEYPRQDIAKILLTLNELIDSSLSSFEIDKGQVDIVGFAQDPAQLIEQLAEREDVYNVVQNRSTSGGNSSSRGERFGIRFNVSGVDFPGYEQKYPVLEP